MSGRPFGITVLVILEVIGGLIWLGSAASLFAAAGMAAMIPLVGLLAGGVLVIIAVISIILGLASFAIAWGFWTRASWSWGLAIGLSILGIILGLLTLPAGIITILINIAIIYYLTRPHVKSYFGKL